MRRRPFSLLTIEEHRARERRARIVRVALWGTLIIGALGALLTPCVHGFHC